MSGREGLRLVGAAEIAGLLGVSRQQVHRLAQGGGFPEPVAVLVMGRVWLLEDVEEWARERRGPGRPETVPPRA